MTLLRPVPTLWWLWLLLRMNFLDAVLLAGRFLRLSSVKEVRRLLLMLGNRCLVFRLVRMWVNRLGPGLMRSAGILSLR